MQDQFKTIVTFYVSVLNATTVFVVSRFFESSQNQPHAGPAKTRLARRPERTRPNRGRRMIKVMLVRRSAASFVIVRLCQGQRIETSFVLHSIYLHRL